MILILGSNGQLGTDLINNLKNSNVDHISLTRNDIDINKIDSLYNILMGYEFTSLINCTGYHKTDEVEDNADQAFKINAFAVKTMIKACKDKDADFYYISTDYVFGGNIDNKRLTENSPTSPVNIYGLSKLLGENFSKKYKKSYIFRVASLYGVAGSSGKGGNFVESIITKITNNEVINVVDDQIMSPTSTTYISEILLSFIHNKYEYGVYNVVNDGELSWYDFAKDICELYGKPFKINRIKTDSLALKANRPEYSALSTNKISNLGISIPSYKTELKKYLIAKNHIK